MSDMIYFTESDAPFVNKTCQRMLLQGFEWEGKLVEEASVVYILSDGLWHSRGIDASHIFGGTYEAHQKDLPRPTSDQHLYPIRDIGTEFSLSNKKITSYLAQSRAADEISFIEICFESGEIFRLENINDLSTFKIVGVGLIDGFERRADGVPAEAATG